MYIPEFWCGVFATILCEIVVSTLIVICSNLRKGNKDESDFN